MVTAFAFALAVALPGFALGLGSCFGLRLGSGGLLSAGGLVGKGLGCQAAGRVVMGVYGVGWWTGTKGLQGPYWMDTGEAARGGHSIGSGDATGIAGCTW